MSEQIIDGRGLGHSAGVTVENRLMIIGPTTTLEHHINVHHGEAYNFLFETPTPSAGGCILYLKNESENPLILEGMIIQCDAAQVLTIKLAETGTPVGGTTVIPANLNAGSKSTASGTFQTGNNITGLSNGRIVWKHWCKGGDASATLNFDADLIITSNQTMTLYAQNAVASNGFIVMAYSYEYVT